MTDGRGRAGSPPKTRYGRRLFAASRVLAVIAIAIGAAALVGWLLGIEVLKRWAPGFASMKFNTALVTVLAGVSILLQRDRFAPRAGRAIAGVVLGLIGLTAFEYLGLVGGLDELVVRDWPVSIGASAPGRMSISTALNFALIGCALFFLDTEIAERRPGQWFALCGFVLSVLTCLGYLYGAHGLYAIPGFNSVALPTAVAMLLLNIGVLLARPTVGVLYPLTAAADASLIARRLLPAVILGPILLGYLRLVGQRAGYYGTEFGLALFALSNIVLLATVTLRSARTLMRIERERGRAASALTKSEEELSTTLYSIGDGVIATNDRGVIVRMNPAAEQLTGWRVESAVHRPLAEVFCLLDGETGEPIESPAERVLREGTTVGRPQRAMLKSRSGELRPIADSGAPIRRADGTVGGVVLVFRDQTDAQRMEATMRDLELANRLAVESNRLKSEFLANMSHELRTPLNAVLGFSGLLAQGAGGPVNEAQREMLLDIERSGKHLLNLINDVLDLAKVEAGRIDVHVTDTELGILVNEVTNVVRGLLTERRVKLAVSIDATIGTVAIDARMAKQVICNYLSNAIKFSPEQSTVTIDITPVDETRFCIAVTDQGIGIPSAEVARLFRAFEQLDSGTARRYQGTGLGLALTKRLVEAQGGFVEVQSEEGKGSTFSAVLPRRVMKAAAPD